MAEVEDPPTKPWERYAAPKAQGPWSKYADEPPKPSAPDAPSVSEDGALPSGVPGQPVIGPKSLSAPASQPLFTGSLRRSLQRRQEQEKQEAEQTQQLLTFRQNLAGGEVEAPPPEPDGSTNTELAQEVSTALEGEQRRIHSLLASDTRPDDLTFIGVRSTPESPGIDVVGDARQKVMDDYWKYLEQHKDVLAGNKGFEYRRSKLDQGAWTDRDAMDLEMDALRHQAELLRVKTEMQPTEEGAANYNAGLEFLQWQAETLIDRHSEVAREDLDLLAQREAAQPTGFGAHVVHPARIAAASFAANMLKTPRTFSFNDEYGWTDALAEYADNVIGRSKAIHLPKEYFEPLVKDGDVNWGALPSKATETIVDMAYLVVPSMGKPVGLVANAFLQTNSDYYQEALKQGLSAPKAFTYASTAATANALLELVSPQKYLGTAFTQEAKRDFGRAAIKSLSDGGTSGEAIKAGVKTIAKEIGQENMQEFSQMLSDLSVAKGSDMLLGTDFDKKFNWDDVAETALLTTIASGLYAGASVASSDPIKAASIKWAVENRGEFDQYLQDAKGLDEQAKTDITERLDKYTSIYKGNDLLKKDPLEAAKVADLIEQKKAIESDIKENPADKLVTEAGGDPRVGKVEKLGNEILDELGLELPDETKPKTIKAKAAPAAPPKGEAPASEGVEGGADTGAQQAITPEDVHAAADEAGVAWDNDPAFMAKSKELTGVEHLDEMTPEQRGVMVEWVKKEGSRARTAQRLQAREERGQTIKDIGNMSDADLGADGVAARYLAVGGRVGTESLISELGLRNPGTGKTGEELRRKLWAHSKDSPSIEKVSEQLSEGTNLDQQEVRNALVENLRNSTGRSSLIEEMRSRLPQSLDEMEAAWRRQQASDEDIAAIVLDAPATAEEDSDIEASLDQMAAEEMQALANEYDQYVASLPDAEQGPTAQFGAQQGAGDVAAQAAPVQGDTERERLQAEVGRSKRELSRAEADINTRGQSLFPPEEGQAQTSIDAGFENTPENYERILSPLRERVAVAERAVSDYDAKAPERIRAASQQTSITDQAAPPRLTQRFPVSPITGEVKGRSAMLRDLSRGVGRRVSYVKPGRRGSAGTYSPQSTAIKIRYSGDLSTTAHEIAHALDDRFGMVPEAMKDLQALAELGRFSEYGSAPPRGHPDPAQYRAAEGMAEFIHAMVVNPEAAKAEAPSLFSLYQSKVDQRSKDAIEQFSQDVRALAGATGRDMVLSNIEVDPQKKEGILADLFKDEDYRMTFVDRVKANWVDPLKAFSKAIEYAKDVKGVEHLDPSKDPYLLARMLLHVGGKTSEILDSGMIDARFQPITANGKPKNIEWLLEPLDNTSMQTVEGEMKDVIAYMVAERTVELGKRFGRGDVLTGIGGGLFGDTDVASKTLSEYELGDPAKLARIKEAADRYRQFSTHILEYMRDKGRISQEQFDQIKANNVQYVALQRIMESAPGEEIEVFKGTSGKLGSAAKPVHSIFGSSRTILNPYVSLMDSLNKSIKEADRNEVMRAFRDLLTTPRQMYEGEPQPLSAVGHLGKQGDKNSITVFVDGKPEHWVLHPDIHAALKGLDDDGYKLPFAVRALPSVMRWSVTHFPVFAARNWIRDLQSRMILSTEGSGLRELIGNKEHWKDVARAGGLNAGYYVKDRAHYYGLLREAMDDIAKNKKFILLDPVRLSGLWHGYENALWASETSNRVAEYRAAFKNAKAKGIDDYNAQLYAAFRSADLIDFALAGHHAKILNQVVPFSNAMIQGLRSAYVHGRRNPGGFALRLMLYGVIPSILLWLWNHRDEDEAEEYENIPAHQRDMFWNFKVGDNRWVTIPRPFELSLPGAAVDRMMSAYAGNDKAFDGYAGSALRSFVPDESALAGPLKVPVELMTNYDFFRDKPIVPPHENDLAMEMRDTKDASRVSQFLQDHAGMDARKWDHLIGSQLPYFGRTALKISDTGRGDDRNQFDLSDLGFFRGSPAYNSAVVTELTEIAHEYRLTSSDEYMRFRKAADRYFNAKTDKEKDRRAGELTQMADQMIEKMKKAGAIKVKNKEAELVEP